jgi:DNA-binding NarL/FixJ family response regulator
MTAPAIEARTRPTTVLIVDDHEVVRTGVRMILGAADDLSVLETVGSGRDALRAIDVHRPDVVILDYNLPDSDGARICREIVRRWPRTTALILTASADDDVLFSSLAAGARGFLTKDASSDALPDAVRRLARGEAVLAPLTIHRVIEWARQAKRQTAGLDPMAPFEIEILVYMSRGWSNRQIADALRVSNDAVKVRIRKIKRRIGASDRAQAVAIAARHGLI